MSSGWWMPACMPMRTRSPRKMSTVLLAPPALLPPLGGCTSCMRSKQCTLCQLHTTAPTFVQKEHTTNGLPPWVYNAPDALRMQEAVHSRGATGAENSWQASNS